VWQVWKSPEDGSASPIPTDFEEGLTDGVQNTETLSIWTRFKNLFPYLSRYEVEAIQYPPSHVEDYDKDLPPAVWTTNLNEMNSEYQVNTSLIL
jgi:hypothetical protein